MSENKERPGSRDTHYDKDLDYHRLIGEEYHSVVVEPRQFATELLLGPLDRFVPSAGSMLDIGCGTGHMLLRYGKRFTTKVGVDHSKEMLASARRNLEDADLGDTILVRGDLLEFLAQDPSRYDLITCVGCIHHLHEPDVAPLLAQMKRHLNPNGTLLIAEPIEVPYDCPPAIVEWNSQSAAAATTYSTNAEEPDEAPIEPTEFIRTLTGSGLRVVRESRTWEILPHSLSPGWMERLKIRMLHRRYGDRGNILALAARRFDQSQA